MNKTLYIGLGLPDGSIAVMQKNKKGLIGTIRYSNGGYDLNNVRGGIVGRAFSMSEVFTHFERISNRTKRTRVTSILEGAINQLLSTENNRWNKHARIYLNDLVRELNSMP